MENTRYLSYDRRGTKIETGACVYIYFGVTGVGFPPNETLETRRFRSVPLTAQGGGGT